MESLSSLNGTHVFQKPVQCTVITDIFAVLSDTNEVLSNGNIRNSKIRKCMGWWNGAHELKIAGTRYCVRY